jgi:hypothetical protein
VSAFQGKANIADLGITPLKLGVELQSVIGVEVRRGSSALKNADITMGYAMSSNLEKTKFDGKFDAPSKAPSFCAISTASNLGVELRICWHKGKPRKIRISI